MKTFNSLITRHFVLLFVTTGLVASGCATSEQKASKPSCGDGKLNGDEVCDDGVNDDSYEGCASDCLSEGPFCGDGVANGPEECDDDNDNNFDACLVGCIAAFCGDQYLWQGVEVCDDGTNSGEYGFCLPDCSGLGPHCGDGEVNGPEECDDGINDGAYGGCASNCMLGPFCGDGDEDPEEECDDGNDENDDGCLTDCTGASCGDGYVWDGVEACDDGVNDNSYDGCAEDCLSLGPHCGDGEKTESEEECDDGNDLNTDACTEGCLNAFCGDAFIWEGEEICDDGVNDGAYDGCEAGCQVLGPHCGDAIPNGDEACDDGVNDGAYDGCEPGCMEFGPYCGDGDVFYDEEECDDGNEAVGDGCTSECVEEYCGDGLLGWSRPKDGFETGDLTQLPWTLAPETTTTGSFAVVEDVSGAHTGDYMLVSDQPQPGGFDDTYATITLVLDVMIESDMCFWYKIDGSIFNDAIFTVDGEEIMNESPPADIAWTEFCTSVEAGEGRIFTFEFYQSWMADGLYFYLDDITFPVIDEECEDSNTDIGDGCNSNCLDEPVE